MPTSISPVFNCVTILLVVISEILIFKWGYVFNNLGMTRCSKLLAMVGIIPRISSPSILPLISRLR